MKFLFENKFIILGMIIIVISFFTSLLSLVLSNSKDNNSFTKTVSNVLAFFGILIILYGFTIVFMEHISFNFFD